MIYKLLFLENREKTPKKLKRFYKDSETFHKNEIGFPSDHLVIVDGLHLHFDLTAFILNKLFVILILLKFYKITLDLKII